MQIKDKLTLLFICIVALILGIATLTIYYSSAQYRKEEFYSRMESKARSAAQLLIDVEEVDAELLRKIEKNSPVTLPNGEIIILNYKNQVLYKSADHIPLKISNVILDQIRVQEMVRYNEGSYEVLGFLYADKLDRVVVISAAIDVYGYSKLKNLRNVLMIVFGSGLVITFISARIFSHRALKPISSIIEQMEKIGIENLGSRLNVGNGKDEIARLAQTFNAMLQRLQAAFVMQKNFIANASHELRTPLTAVTGQLELSLMQQRTEKEYITSIKSVLDDIKNLNLLSDRLLLLAQTSNETPNGSFSRIRVDEVLWQSVSEISKRSPQYHTQILFDQNLDEDRLWITGNEFLLKIAFLNLMDNGCKYSEPQEVKVKLLSGEKFIQIKFLDQGIGIPPEDLDHIFEPFHRGRNVQKIKGHGIGLSLVKQIAKLHKGILAVNSQNGNGSEFTLLFPL
ncbi:HAMP domain-containing sensor histidine kinase [soil metagenome]